MGRKYTKQKESRQCRSWKGYRSPNWMLGLNEVVVAWIIRIYIGLRRCLDTVLPLRYSLATNRRLNSNKNTLLVNHNNARFLCRFVDNNRGRPGYENGQIFKQHRHKFAKHRLLRLLLASITGLFRVRTDISFIRCFKDSDGLPLKLRAVPLE